MAPWNPILSRIQKRLAGWKGSLLSEGGKLVLLKSVLASLPTYYLSLFSIPMTVERKIEQYQREFLWGKGKQEDGIHLVDWEDMCKPKKMGGLGITRVREVNKALLTIWLWRFSHEKESLWRQVVAEKCGVINE